MSTMIMSPRVPISTASNTRDIFTPLTLMSPTQIFIFGEKSEPDFVAKDLKRKIRKSRGTSSEGFAYLQKFHHPALKNGNASYEADSIAMPIPFYATIRSRRRVSNHSTDSIFSLVSTRLRRPTAPSLAMTPKPAYYFLSSVNGIDYDNSVYGFNTHPL